MTEETLQQDRQFGVVAAREIGGSRTEDRVRDRVPGAEACKWNEDVKGLDLVLEPCLWQDSETTCWKTCLEVRETV